MSGGIAFFRQAEWLNPSRVRGYAVIVGLASLMILGFAYREALSATGSDFLAFWGAGQATASGNPAAAYDLDVQERVQTATGSKGWFAFVNPPPFLFVTVPLGFLPYPAAWPLWVAVTYALWAWAAIRAFPMLWPIVLAYPGALIGASHAQTGLLTGALLVFATTQIDRRPIAAGATIGALIIKPHLALLLPFWLAAGGRWRAFFAAGTSVAVLLAASMLAFGPSILPAYATSWDASAKLMREADSDFLLRMCTLYAQARNLGGPAVATIAAILSAIIAIGAAALAWRRFGGDPRGSAAAVLAATALASPYLFNYDLAFLVVPTLWLVEQGLSRGFRPYEKLALVALWLAPYALRAVALPLSLNPMPLASLILLALVWSRGGSDHLAKGERAP